MNSHLEEQSDKQSDAITQNKQSQPQVPEQPPAQESTQPQKQQAQHDNKSFVSDQEQIPEHFYDSDIASVCEKDFLSDNEPPKDIVQERKLLYKEKLLHVFKTIIRVGAGIDKPARYDKIRLRMRQVPKEQVKQYLRAKKEGKKGEKEEAMDKEEVKGQEQVNCGSKQEITQEAKQETKQQKPQQQMPSNQSQPQQPTNSQPNPLEQQYPKTPVPQFFSTAYLQPQPQQTYNIGTRHQQLQRLVTSMKRGQTALFELEHLTVSKKSNIKLKELTQIVVIQVFDWTTVIDLDGDMRLLKYVITKGEGAFRVALYDRITFSYSLKRGHSQIAKKEYHQKRLQPQFIDEELPKTVWRVLTSMKDQEQVQLQIKDQDLKQLQSEQLYKQLNTTYEQLTQAPRQQPQTQPQSQPQPWTLSISISNLIKVDDIYLDGRLLKQTLVKGVSTARAQSSSLVFYALKFLDSQEVEIKKDQCFDSDWWEDFGKLSQLNGIRKSYLDDYSTSKMLKKVIKRMKPAEIAYVECRDNELFQFGQDYEEMKQLLKFDQTPERIKLVIRIYNFTQAKTAFNMEIQEKIQQSQRLKPVAVRLLQQNKLEKALKRFQAIIAFYSSQKINQQAYEQKVSALMNAILCYMKMKKFNEMIKLCNEVLLKPRHGHQSKDLKIVGPGHAKIQGSLPKEGQEDNEPLADNGDTRRIATELTQNQKILDKCLYRKAFALVQIGQCAQALQSLDQISQSMNTTEQVVKLKKQALTGKEKYEQKSKKIFKSMFG